MNVGIIGLGKIGLPIALTLEYHGAHQVVGYDVSPLPARILAGEAPPPAETGIGPLLEASSLKVLPSAAEVVAASDVVLVTVQTPHAPAFGGETPVAGEPEDFEYAFLVQAVRDVCQAAETQGRHITVVVVSTVLPGTTNRLLRPLAGEHASLLYSPAFIAMGTTIRDFCDPEFVVIGADRHEDARPLMRVLGAVHDSLLIVTSFETAEAVKVLYNTAISAKIVLANTIMEICHKTGADCDVVTDALAHATDRVVSAKYLSGGMGDGGSCHPRDLTAMSWLARRLDLSYDLLGEMARARDAQTGWLADMAVHYATLADLPVVILGKAYKPGSNLTAGSPALLLANMLYERGVWTVQWDPYTDAEGLTDAEGFALARAVYVVATRHPEFTRIDYPQGSVVLDPWGYIPDAQGVTVIRIGRKS